jgi:hypothetical protein
MEMLDMTGMTVLHIASPFAFSMPVAESRSSESAGGDPSGTGQHTQHTQADRPSTQTNTARENGVIDARDARSAMVRPIDFAPASEGANAASGSLDAVLAAYQQDGPAKDDTEGPTA